MARVVTAPSSAPDIAQGISSRQRANQRLFGRDWQIAWLFLLPLLIVLIGLVTYPFVTGIILSMQRKVVGEAATWVGFANYRALLTGDQYSNVFWQSVRVSFLYTGVAVAFKMLFGMSMALMLNENFPGRTAMRALLFIPWAMPTVIVALTWRWILDGSLYGLINYIRVEYFGAGDLIQFLANPSLALWAVVLVVIWQGTPFYTMMMLAGMQAIPNDQYEAAALDGATVFQRFRDVTLPALRSPIIVTALLSTIWTANSINFVFVLTHGGPVNATMTFPMLAYEIGIAGARQLGLAAAVSVLFFPIFIVAIVVLTKRMLSAEGRA